MLVARHDDDDDDDIYSVDKIFFLRHLIDNHKN